MKTSLARWGNSLAVRLPKSVTEEMQLHEGASIEIEVDRGSILLRPTRPHYTLDQLLHGVTRKSMRKAWSWGPGRGREVVDE